MNNSPRHRFQRSHGPTVPHALFVLFALLCLGAFAAVGGGGELPAEGDPSAKNWTLLIFFVCLSTGVSFLCSIAEAVLLSISPSFVEKLKSEGSPFAQELGKMKENIERPLSTILTLNTIAHTVGALGSGLMAGKIWGSSKWMWITIVTWFTIVYTINILFASEIVPKTIGSVYHRKLAGLVTRGVGLATWPLLPLIWLMEMVTKVISGGKKHSVFSKEEYAAMADIGEKEGHLDANESTIVRNLMRFQELNATDIMTPRTVMFALPADGTVGEILAEHSEKPFSRIPIYGEDRDDIIGFVLKSDLLHKEALDQSNVKARELVNAIAAVPATINLTDLLQTMLDKREHIMLVVGEYGGTAGLVTLEDLVETLLGMEIVDEVDNHEDMQALARAQWKKRAERLKLFVPETGIEAEAEPNPNS